MMYPAPPNQDLEHLHWLAIGHYIYAALVACFSAFGLLFVGLGIAMIARPQAFQPNPPPPFLGPLFATMGAGVTVVVLAYAVLSLLAGRYIAQRRRHLFCLIISGVNCLWMPIGTVLGVLTILVLVRPSVKAMFAGASERAGTSAGAAR
jgi:hypothetical protein